MYISVLDIFKIGIGPSSSHTVGPMRAARRFLQELKEREYLEETASLQVELYGSLAMTGKGHATDIALLLGLEGESPELIKPDDIPSIIARIERNKKIDLFGRFSIPFDPEQDIVYFKRKRLPFHSNGLRFNAYLPNKKLLHSTVFYSVGGGFVISHAETKKKGKKEKGIEVPYPFKTADELFSQAKQNNLTIAQLVMENEKALRPEEEVRSGILKIFAVMKESVKRGIQNRGEIPGGLKVQRRAGDIHDQLVGRDLSADPTLVLEWVSLFALAVNEENAAGGRVVTAPTNGAAGVIPAVLCYAEKFIPTFDEEALIEFFLTAAAIAILYKEGASLSAAEMGCQGEIGVACSMAAGALAAVLGGNLSQIENGAEIGMEHNLGLTCDPAGGLVQIPCIERNTMGAIKAINAARLALRGKGEHRVSLDACIRAMREIGENMKTEYKETSEGGLALLIPLNEVVC